MTRLTLISSLLIFGITACKKADNYDYDREKKMVLDTASLLKGVQYVSHTSTSLAVQIDMLTFNGLMYETDFSGYTFDDTIVPGSYTSSTAQAEISCDYSATSTGTLAPLGSYASAFLINQANKDWFEERYVGFYMRRYYELIDSLGVSFAALAHMDLHLSGNEHYWNDEVAGSHFWNYWEYSINNFYTLTNDDDPESSFYFESNGANFDQELEEIITEIASDGVVTNGRSLTIFTAGDVQGGSIQAADPDIDATVALANANSIPINFIGPIISDVMVRYASETGGFIAEADNRISGEEGNEAQTDPVGDIAVYLQNLNQILTNDAEVHRCNAVFTQTGATTFNSGERWMFHFKYNDELFRFTVKIP